jgi:hypothetical protein
MGLGFYAVIIVGRVELRFKGYFTMTAWLGQVGK